MEKIEISLLTTIAIVGLIFIFKGLSIINDRKNFSKLIVLTSILPIIGGLYIIYSTIKFYIETKKSFSTFEKLYGDPNYLEKISNLKDNIMILPNHFGDDPNMIIKRNEEELVKQKGIKLIAEIKNLKMINEYNNSFIIISEGINPLTNKLQTFQSHFIVGDPNKIKDKKTIDIYIDPDNPSKYYTDISSIISNKNIIRNY